MLLQEMPSMPSLIAKVRVILTEEEVNAFAGVRSSVSVSDCLSVC